MKDLYEFLLERLSIEQYREYAMVKRDPRSEAWLSAFWERVKELPQAEVSRNGHRVYFKFELPAKDLEMSDQQDAYGGASVNIKANIHKYLTKMKYDVVKLDYIHGKFTYVMKTQRGDKERDMNIGKVLTKAAKTDEKAKELLDQFSNDPLRLTSNLDAKKLLIVLSNHAYDIAGMSTDRKWTSCMNIINGSNARWVKEDIKWGTVVAYLVEENDKNINNPLGRILIKPYFDENNAVVYFPEPTVYSPYVGLDSMREYLQEMCTHIANRVSWLYKIARDTNDPNQQAPSRAIIPKSEFTKKDIEVMKDLTQKEWDKLEKQDDAKYRFLFYYDDYFEKNKDYVGMRPADPKDKKLHKLQ